MSKRLPWSKPVFTSFLLFIFAAVPIFAQQIYDFTAEREKAINLINEKQYAEAIPLLEKLSANPKADGQIFLGLGLSYWSLQDTKKDKNEWKQIRLKARDAFLKAKENNVSVPEIDLIIASIKPNGGDKGTPDDPRAVSAMKEADAAFAARDYEKALTAYEKAATIDPTHYEAALYTADTYFAMKQYDKAGVWFAKAIAIDPDRETAYRYWADGLSAANKNIEAEDKYFSAIVAEPYSSAAWRGLMQYAQKNNFKLAHPKIEVPVDFSASADGNTKITLGISGSEKKDDGAFAWTAYGMSRAVWQTGKDGKLSERYAKAYPNAKVYRHSLAEEREALHSVVAVLKDSKEAKNPEQSLVLLKQLDGDGLLEAYILFARSDAQIRQDYPAYRQQNRESLKRYLKEYVMKSGSN